MPIDMPPSVNSPEAVVVAEFRASAKISSPPLVVPNKTDTVDKVLWSGQTVEQDGGSHSAVGEVAQGRLLEPTGEALSLLKSSGWLQEHGIRASNPRTSVVIETRPKHGRLDEINAGDYKGGFRYTPRPKFLGKDFASFVVTIEDKKVRVVTPLFVVKDIDEPR